MSEYPVEEFANARINPTYRTIQNWHDQWRAVHLGPRIGQGVVEVVIFHRVLYIKLFILLIGSNASLMEKN